MKYKTGKKFFPKSVSTAKKLNSLILLFNSEDKVAIVINADPDAIASSMAFKRLLWRKVLKADILHVNEIDRLDNRLMVKMVRAEIKPLASVDQTTYTKWAIVDSQPHHHPDFEKIPIEFVIDHHPMPKNFFYDNIPFVDIRPDYGSVATVMTEYLRAAGIKPVSRLATALFYAIETDTDNFVRKSIGEDINAFKFLYSYTNMNVIKKLKSSEFSVNMLDSFKRAMDAVFLYFETIFVHLDFADNSDTLVRLADFFLRFSEATQTVVSGCCEGKLIIIFRSSKFRGDVGKTAESVFGKFGSAGGHKSAARAEIPLEALGGQSAEDFVFEHLKRKSKRSL